jgi:hypothetical protein
MPLFIIEISYVFCPAVFVKVKLFMSPDVPPHIEKANSPNLQSFVKQ